MVVNSSEISTLYKIGIAANEILYRTAIAHLIREQIHVYKKSLLVLGEEEQQHEPSQMGNAIRDNQQAEVFTPAIIELTDAMIERMEKDQTRESR